MWTEIKNYGTNRTNTTKKLKSKVIVDNLKDETSHDRENAERILNVKGERVRKVVTMSLWIPIKSHKYFNINTFIIGVSSVYNIRKNTLKNKREFNSENSKGVVESKDTRLVVKQRSEIPWTIRELSVFGQNEKEPVWWLLRDTDKGRPSRRVGRGSGETTQDLGFRCGLR